MRVTVKQIEGFKPVSVTLLCETQEEVNALYAVGNFSGKVAGAIGGFSTDAGHTVGDDVNNAVSPLHDALRNYINVE